MVWGEETEGRGRSGKIWEGGRDTEKAMWGRRGVGNERNLVHLVEKSVEIKLKS